MFWSSSVTNIDYPGGRYAARTQSRLGRLFRTQGTEIIYQIAGSSKAKDLSLFRTYLLGLALILDELSQRTKSHKKTSLKWKQILTETMLLRLLPLFEWTF